MKDFLESCFTVTCVVILIALLIVGAVIITVTTCICWLLAMAALILWNTFRVIAGIINF